VWAVDFQFDATTDGPPIKIMSLIDEHTRECLGGLVEHAGASAAAEQQNIKQNTVRQADNVVKQSVHACQSSLHLDS
jgi:hypothetical protein